MKNENYITVLGWMVNELQLSGNELVLYALIYGFSQDGKSRFKGAAQYLADSLRMSKWSALRLLKKLVEKDLIIKYKSGPRGHEKCDYGVNSEKINQFCGEEAIPPSGEKITPQNDNNDFAVRKSNRQRCENLSASGEKITHHINIHNDIDTDINLSEKSEPEPQDSPTACAVDQKEIVPVFQGNSEQTKIAPVSKPPPEKAGRKRGIELTEDQKPLFHAAKACFEADERTRAIMYQDRGSAQMYMQNLKLFVARCSKMAPGITADFMKTVLEHFKVICGGRLKGKAEFNPRALITPWIWEIVISSLPEPENELDEEIRQSIKGMFK